MIVKAGRKFQEILISVFVPFAPPQSLLARSQGAPKSKKMRGISVKEKEKGYHNPRENLGGTGTDPESFTNS
jgi:hypothetical protein